MMMSVFQFLLNAILSLVGSVFLLRAWLWYNALSPRHPLYDVCIRLTDWFYRPVNKWLPSRGGWDWPSLLGAVLTACVMTLLKSLDFIGLSPLAWLMMPIFTLVGWILEWTGWGVFIWCVLTWVAPTHPLTYTLELLLEPLVKPARRLGLKAGNFDFSPIVLLILITTLQYLLAIVEGKSMML